MFYRDNHTANYTQIANSVFADKEISLAAKGLLCSMLSKPDNWKFALSRIARDNGVGVCAVRSAIKELRDAGYVVDRGYLFKEGLFDGHNYDIYETRQPRGQATR